MKLLWVGTFIMLFASLVSLISTGHGDSLIQRSWAEASRVIPETTLTEIQDATPRVTARLFESLPQPFRERLTRKMWSAVELMTFRFFVMTYVAPALLLPPLIGLLEGWWARANQKRLIKIHSPMRFSLAVTGLGLIPILALLWLAAPMAIPAIVLVAVVSTSAIFNTRNLIVHAPTQF